jgi:hypothetical protein
LKALKEFLRADEGARALERNGHALSSMCRQNAAMARLPLPVGVLNLLHDEERAGNLVIWGSGAVCAVCLAVALLAIAVMS